MKFHIPIKLPSLANARMHWKKMAALKQKQREATAVMLHVSGPIPALPLIVTITRIGPRVLDDDNLASSCKYVRDQIATAIGVDDGSPLYTWRYKQRAGHYGVEVEINPRVDETTALSRSAATSLG